MDHGTPGPAVVMTKHHANRLAFAVMRWRNYFGA
jgi:hypothetical protein